MAKSDYSVSSRTRKESFDLSQLRTWLEVVMGVVWTGPGPGPCARQLVKAPNNIKCILTVFH